MGSSEKSIKEDSKTRTSGTKLDKVGFSKSSLWPEVGASKGK